MESLAVLLGSAGLVSAVGAVQLWCQKRADYRSAKKATGRIVGGSWVTVGKGSVRERRQWEAMIEFVDETGHLQAFRPSFARSPSEVGKEVRVLYFPGRAH